MNIHEFIDELRGHFNTPKNLQRVYEVMQDRLKNTTGEDLKACAETLITTRTSKSWPPVSIILQALSEAQRQRRRNAPQSSMEGDMQWDLLQGTSEYPVIRRGSPPWLAWLDYRRNHGLGVRYMTSSLSSAERFTVQTIWPPGYERHKAEYIARAAKWEDER